MDRRTRTRAAAGGVAADHGFLGQGKLNPFGDLHTLQHLSARLARGLRGVFEPLLRQESRVWAEPLSVQRFADYRAERGDGLTAWLPFAMQPASPGAGGTAYLAFGGGFVLELLDLFFGGTGATPHPLPTEFSPAAEAMIARLGASLAVPLAAAWEPLSPCGFVPGRVEPMAAIDADDAAIITRFGIAAGAGKPVFLDLLYPVTALKPHGQALTGKVVSKPAEPDAAWRTGLTRAAMNVRFTVRSVLAEPTVPLQTLIDLKPGDVIPIHFGQEVPVMVGGDCLGRGVVGTANGQAAIRLTSLALPPEGQTR